MQDLRDAYRALVATPLVSCFAVAALALAIGANTAIFTIADNLVLKALPVPDADRLALVAEEEGNYWATFAGWEAFRDRDVFEDAFAWSREEVGGGEAEAPERIDVILATSRFFDVLAVSAIRGRTFSSHDENGDAVVVLSYDYWQSRYGGSDDAVGDSLRLEEVRFTILGVTPPGFQGPDIGIPFDLVVPIWNEPLLRPDGVSRFGRVGQRLRILGRRHRGRSLEQTTAAIQAAQPSLREASLPDYAFERLRNNYMRAPLIATSASTGASNVQRRYRDPVVTLMVVVALVLLIACANVANLLLARGAGRRRELAMRAALGASRRRLVQQLMIEGVLLASVASAVGLVLGYWGSHVLVAQMTTTLQTVQLAMPLDARVVLFTIATGVLTVAAFTCWPAIQNTAVPPTEALRGAPYGLFRSLKASGGLVIGQVALSLVLVTGAAFFVRTFYTLANVPLGFDPDPVVLVDVDTRKTSFTASDRPALYETVRQAVDRLPAVEIATASTAVPVGFRAMTTTIEPPGQTLAPEAERRAEKHIVTPGWFQTFGTSLLEGRDVTNEDRRGAPHVAVVNESFVRRFLPGQPPIGAVVREQRPSGRERVPVDLEIVGVVEDVVYRSVRDAAPPTLYAAAAQADGVGHPWFYVAARPARGDPLSIARDVRAAIHAIDPRFALTVRAMGDQVRATYNHERVLALVVSAFGGLALVLAALGLFGVVSYAVTSRRRDIAVRLALGADPSLVTREAVSRALLLVTAGLAIGTALSLWAVQFIQSLLFGLPARMTPVYGFAAALLGLVAVAAAWLPARTAARIDPADTLRQG